jgi:hypothetical protein
MMKNIGATDRALRIFIGSLLILLSLLNIIGREFDHKVLDWVSTVTWSGNIGTIPDRIGYFVPVSFAERADVG